MKWLAASVLLLGGVARADERAQETAADAADDARVRKDPRFFADQEQKCRAARNASDALACREAVLPYIATNPEYALELAGYGCRADHRLCDYLGVAGRIGRRGMADRAIHALQTSCDRGDLAACTTIGNLLEANRWGFAPDLERAQAALEKGASADDETTLMYLEGTLQMRRRPDAEIAAVHQRFVAAKARRERAEAAQAAVDARMAQELAPFEARAKELDQEKTEQEHDRVKLDRLDPDDAGDQVRAGAFERAAEWQARRGERAEEIEALYADLAPNAPPIAPVRVATVTPPLVATPVPRAKPLYEKWWFWALVGVGAYFIFYEIESSSSGDTARVLPSGPSYPTQPSGVALFRF